MIKRKNILKIAIDSPAAAGAGTLAKAISKNYNLFYLDTGKIYRFIAYLKIKFPTQFNNKFIKSKIKSLKMKNLSNNYLLSDKVGTEASIISKIKSIRFYYWVMDLQPELSISSGLIKKDSILAKILTFFGNYSIKNSKKIFSMDSYMSQHLIDRGAKKNQIYNIFI